MIKTSYILPLAFLFACNKPTNSTVEKPIARAYDKYLFAKDLEGVVPEGVTGSDSIVMVNGFIEIWMKQIALLKQAERNVIIDEQRLQKEIADYRNSLLIYEYQQAIVNSKLDTAVTEGEIAWYYQNNPDNFILENPIYQVDFLKTSKSDKNLPKLRRQINSSRYMDNIQLMNYCIENLKEYSFGDSSWMTINRLNDFIPTISMVEEKLDVGKTIEISSSNDVFLVACRAKKLTGSVKPIELAKREIKTLVINKRRQDLMEENAMGIFKKAFADNNLEFIQK